MSLNNNYKNQDKFYVAVGDIDEKFLEEFNENKDFSQNNQDLLFIKSNKSIKKYFLASIVAVPLICGMGYHTDIFVNVIDTFSPIFGSNAVQTKIIEEIAYPIGAVNVNNGIIISADAIIGDDTSAVVVYTIRSEDENTLPKLPEVLEQPQNGWHTTYYWGFNNYFLEGFTSSGSTTIKFLEKDNGTFQCIQEFSYDKLPIRKKVTASFQDIGYYKVETFYENGEPIEINNEFFTEIKGDWEINYRFNYRNSSTTIIKNKEFIYNNRLVEVNNLIISPFSISISLDTLKFDKDAIKFKESLNIPDSQYFTQEKLESFTFSEELNEELLESLILDSITSDLSVDFINSIPVSLTKTDGSTIELKISSSNILGSSNYENISVNSRILFDEIIPIDKIASITFGNIVEIINK